MEFWSSGAFFFVEQINFTYLSIFASTFPKLYNKAASKPQNILISPPTMYVLVVGICPYLQLKNTFINPILIRGHNLCSQNT